MSPLRIDTDLRPSSKRPLALVLSGGGARGAFQAGVWKILREDPRGLRSSPDIMSGTSAGALNAVLIAAGLSPDDILSFWIDLADDPPVSANPEFFRFLSDVVTRLMLQEPTRGWAHRTREFKLLAGMLKRYRWASQSGVLAAMLQFFLTARFDTVSSLLDGIHTSYLFDTSPFRARLVRYLGGNIVPRTDVKLAINTVDVRTGSPVRIVNHPPVNAPKMSRKHYLYEPNITVDMVLASASIPILFNPVEVHNRLLWDGGLLVNTPMAPAVALGAKRVIPVLVTKAAVDYEHLKTFGMALERLIDSFLENAYNVDRKLLLDRNELVAALADPELHAVQLFRAMRPEASTLFNAGSYLYFERSAIIGMYEAGKRAAIDWLERGPEVDSRDAED